MSQLWSTATGQRNQAAGGGRGRGRGKPYGEEEGSGWGRGQERDGSELWDDLPDQAKGKHSGSGVPLDLADFAAAALHFQANTRGISHDTANALENEKFEEDDPLEKLLREQMALEGENGLGADPDAIPEEEDDLPDWATEDDRSALSSAPPALPAVGSAASDSKRNLLLEVCQVYLSRLVF
jgi:hypothetical protein